MRSLAVVSVCLLLAGVAGAQLVTYAFTGTVDKVNFNTNNAFPEGYVGRSFSGWFSFSSDSRTTEIGSMAFSIGSFQSPVINDRLYPPVSLPSIYFYYYERTGNYDFGRTGFTFANYSGPAFGSKLPTDIALSMFSAVRFSIQGSKIVNGVYSGNFDISGPVSTLQLIPEPATIALLAAGGLLLRKR